MLSERMNKDAYNLTELATILTEAAAFSGRSGDTIYLRGKDGDGVRVQLIEEMLSDGSSVFDLIITPHKTT